MRLHWSIVSISLDEQKIIGVVNIFDLLYDYAAGPNYGLIKLYEKCVQAQYYCNDTYSNN